MKFVASRRQGFSVRTFRAEPRHHLRLGADIEGKLLALGHAHATLRATVEVGTHEIGTGIRTVITLTVADLLGLPIDSVETRIGDSQLPAAPLSAGSNTTATITSVLAKCCGEIRERLASAASNDKRSALFRCDPNSSGSSTVTPWSPTIRKPARKAHRSR